MANAYQARFATAAARVAYSVTAHDLGKLFKQLSDGSIFMAVAEGAGASSWAAVPTDNTGMFQIPLTAFHEADGTILAAFSGGASTTPGWAAVDSEVFGIRWNNHANPDPIGTTYMLPLDLDEASALTLHFVASKTGATLGDAVTWTCQVFFQTDAALHDADADAGGASSAMTGDATAKTVQIETLSIAAGDIPALPAAMTLTIQPTDGTLGTDDVVLIAVYGTYKRRGVTS